MNNTPKCILVLASAEPSNGVAGQIASHHFAGALRAKVKIEAALDNRE